MKKLGSILLLAVIAAPGAAYDHPLGSSAIREAYFKSSGRFAEFLGTYTKNLPAPKPGPHVAQIEVRTPFAQVIVSSHEHSVGYSPMQAAQDYKKNPETLQVRIQICATATYAIDSIVAAPQGLYQGVQRMNTAKECFHEFQFRSRQGENIRPKSSYGVPIYSGGDNAASILVAADVWFVFSTNEIASEPFSVTVSTPDGQMVSAEFDLVSLR